MSISKPVSNVDGGYAAAYVSQIPASGDASRDAWRWEATMANQHDCDITAIAPTRAVWDNDVHVPPHLGVEVHRETPRTLRGNAQRRQVVVALWPTAEDLDRLDGLRGLEALVVVPWLEEKIAVWRRARRAVDLLGCESLPDLTRITDPIVEEATRSLTLRVNLSTGVGHPSDRAAAIETFKVLTSNGHVYDQTEIQVRAMANGWKAVQARELSGLAEGVQDGRRYRTGRAQLQPGVSGAPRRQRDHLHETPI